MTSKEPTSPSVSVILLTRNDRRFVRDCLDSLRTQDRPVEELIVVDCGSVDGTAEVVAATDPDAMLLSVADPRGARTSAIEAGLRLATGDVVVVTTGRARYRSDAVRRSVAALDAGAGPEASVAGTPMNVGTTNFGRAAASAARWLPAAEPTPVAWRRVDHSAPPRRGHRAVKALRAWRYAPETAGELARAGYRAGISSAEGGLHGVPLMAGASAVFALVAGTLAVASTGWRRGAVPAAHLTACLGLAMHAARDPGVAPHRALAAMEIGHWSTAVGVVRGLLRAPGRSDT